MNKHIKVFSVILVVISTIIVILPLTVAEENNSKSILIALLIGFLFIFILSFLLMYYRDKSLKHKLEGAVIVEAVVFKKCNYWNTQKSYYLRYLHNGNKYEDDLIADFYYAEEGDSVKVYINKQNGKLIAFAQL